MTYKTFKQFLLILLILSACINADEFLRDHQRKHKSKLESWSFALRLHNKQDTIHTVVFFVSGKMLFMSGNYVYSGTYNNADGTFVSEGKALVPPFQLVRHNHKRLDERFDNDRIYIDLGSGELNLDIRLPIGKTTISAPLESTPIRFADIFTKPQTRARFEWYLSPLCDITARIENRPGTYKGEGYFQHFWGDEAEQNADWMVAHLEDGSMLIGAHFSPEAAKKPWLPEDYLLRVTPEGAKKMHDDISFTVQKSLRGKKGLYPTSFEINTVRGDRVRFDAYKEKQLSKIHTREAWNGFGGVSAEIEGEKYKGWAYFSPFMRKE